MGLNVLFMNMQDLSFAKRLIDNLSTAVLLVDSDLRLEYLNPAAEMLLAISRTRAIGQPVKDVFFEEADSDTEAAMRHALETGHPFTKREAVLHVGLREVMVDYSVTTLHVPGERSRLIVEAQQIARLLRISRDEALVANHQATRQLVRGVAHEIKNPLGGIRGAAQLLAKALPEDDTDLAEYTTVIIEEADRLRALADRMLGPRKLPERQQVNIHECLERVRSLILAEAKGQVLIQRDYDPSLPELYADPDQLIQAILNIAGNALQALLENPEEGRESMITLRTRFVRQATIGAVRHRLAMKIDIRDNGPGIPAQLMESVFYPMVSGRAAGTGLGLSISQDIIHQYHGLIECESRPGETTFSILLPLEQENHEGR